MLEKLFIICALLILLQHTNCTHNTDSFWHHHYPIIPSFLQLLVWVRHSHQLVSPRSCTISICNLLLPVVGLPFILPSIISCSMVDRCVSKRDPYNGVSIAIFACLRLLSSTDPCYSSSVAALQFINHTEDHKRTKNAHKNTATVTNPATQSVMKLELNDQICFAAYKFSFSYIQHNRLAANS